MKFATPLIGGTLVKRYQRFLADITLPDGTLITAHCANSGSLLTLKSPGSDVWVSKVPEDKERKLRYDWQLIRQGEGLVSINTSLTNHLFEEALTNGTLEDFAPYPVWKREVTCSPLMRVDFSLGGQDKPFFVEIKSVTHCENDVAMFPDSVTARGAKHLGELTKLAQQGARTAVVYVMQRNDKELFSYADHIDPAYARCAKIAQDQGVEFFCFSCFISLDEIRIDRKLEIKDFR